MGGLELLGEGAPDAFFAGAVLFREGLHERADADALVEVGIVGVCAGPHIIDKAEECQTPTIQCNDTVATIFC